MLIDIKFKNYRSIKEEQTFSLKAKVSKIRTNNTYCPLLDYKNLKLLKTAVIYGSNGSGKSNLIRLMWTLKNFVVNSSDLQAGDPIPNRYYDPYLLDSSSKNEQSEITINFIPKNKKRHRYIIKFNKNEILYEYLGIFESTKISKIFERKEANEFVEFGDSMKNKKEDRRVNKNTLYLSKFGKIPNDQIRDIYLYFKGVEVWNIPAIHHINELYNNVQRNFNKPDRPEFRRKLSKLINIADTKITDIQVSERSDKDFEALPVNIREQVIEELKFETFGIHKVFNSDTEMGIQMLSFNDQESQGTRTMFAIGGLMLEAFEKEEPVLIFLDEFNNSLHPELAKFLVELFHNPKVNKNNSQLVFATHETTLLDKKIFRKDQIWFGEKNKFGATDYFSVYDFKELKNVRSDIPFDKWYRTGKFGAIPNIRKYEFISEYEQE